MDKGATYISEVLVQPLSPVLGDGIADVLVVPRSPVGDVVPVRLCLSLLHLQLFT